jgi:hypothetical protein
MWAKLDDGFHDHPKTQAVTCGATGLLCRALTWSMRHLTGGWVPASQIPSLAGLSASEADALVAELVRVRSLDPLEKDGAHGWAIHGIHDYNPTPSEIRKQRKVREEAARIAGNASATKRQRQRCSTVAPPMEHVSTSGATDFNPVPEPVPVPDPVPLGQGDPPLPPAPEPTPLEDRHGVRVLRHDADGQVHEVIPRPVTADTLTEEQERIHGLYLRLLQEVRGIAQPTGDPAGAVRAAQWARGREWPEVERAVRALVADNEAKIVSAGWPLSWLPRRANGYLAGAGPGAAPAAPDAPRGVNAPWAGKKSGRYIP